MERDDILDENLDPIERFEEVEKPKRPTAITVICIIGFLGPLAIIPVLLSGVASQIGAWYLPHLAISSIIGLTCMIGLWNMKKWAAYLYAAMVLINQVVLLTMGVWNLTALLIPGIVIAIAFSHLDKMD